jgi:small subunit ribosomal protein S8e
MRIGKKISGGIYHKARKKKKFEIAGQPRIVKLGKEKKKKIKTLGGKEKMVLLSTDIANLIIPGKKTEKVKIKNVVETPANRFLARQNVLMKSSIIETDKGKARITNRPSQEGCVQAILIEEH